MFISEYEIRLADQSGSGYKVVNDSVLLSRALVFDTEDDGLADGTKLEPILRPPSNITNEYY